jgi:hypothetical protein
MMSIVDMRITVQELMFELIASGRGPERWQDHWPRNAPSRWAWSASSFAARGDPASKNAIPEITPKKQSIGRNATEWKKLRIVK